jgi:hypothetical protein
MNGEKALEFYKKFYDENRVKLLQYDSLRDNFNKMVTDVLGDDYYNMAMDVYDADKICCEDITRKSTGFFKSIFRK